MNKETLARTKEIEQQIDIYNKIHFVMNFPYTKFKLFKKHIYIGHAGYNAKMEVILSDPELAKLIADYCKDKISKLNTELERM